jgi:hypothetical protein
MKIDFRYCEIMLLCVLCRSEQKWERRDLLYNHRFIMGLLHNLTRGFSKFLTGVKIFIYSVQFFIFCRNLIILTPVLKQNLNSLFAGKPVKIGFLFVH